MASKDRTKRAFALAAESLTAKGARDSDVRNLQSLLARYGYLRCGYIPGEYDAPTAAAVSQFQNFYGIRPAEDGLCDAATVRLLNTRRCGIEDHPSERLSMGPEGRLAPFVTVGAKWPRLGLSYRFMNSTPDLPEGRQRDIIREAFARWQAVCGLVFTEVPLNAPSDLAVAFHRGDHGDDNPFDDAGGPGGNTLAHAFYPPPRGGQWAGCLHFDEFEGWIDQPGGAGTRLFNVALHEIGHLLGLAHSQDPNAIMYAYYGVDRNDLRADDIAGAVSLYGAPAPTPANPVAPVALPLGGQVSGFLPQDKAEVRYQVIVQNKLLLRLDGPAGVDFDLYVKFNGPVGVGNGQYDHVSYGVTADELVTIPAPQPGTYNVLVQSYRGSGSFTLRADVT